MANMNLKHERNIVMLWLSDELVLERVGRNHDGGYIIALLGQDAYDLFLSGGVGDDTSFEIHFGNIHRRGTTTCIANFPLIVLAFPPLDDSMQHCSTISPYRNR
jgi:hypothetical protein